MIRVILYCSVVYPSGAHCMAPAQRGQNYCYQHDPARAADRQAAAAKARESRRRHTAEREENVRRWRGVSEFDA